MQLTNSLLHTLLVACDQSHKQIADGGGIVGQDLRPYADSGQLLDRLPDGMPDSWSRDLAGWKVDRGIEDQNTGFAATVVRKAVVGNSSQVLKAEAQLLRKYAGFSALSAANRARAFQKILELK